MCHILEGSLNVIQEVALTEMLLLYFLLLEDSHTPLCSSSLIILSFLTVCYLNQCFSTFFSCLPVSQTENVPVVLKRVVLLGCLW